MIEMRLFSLVLQLLRLLQDDATHVRQRAVKCLIQVIEAGEGDEDAAGLDDSPVSAVSLLHRAELREAVHSRLCDQSILVRESVVDLIGRFICKRPALLSHYYSMICERLLVCLIHCWHQTIDNIRIHMCLSSPLASV